MTCLYSKLLPDSDAAEQMGPEASWCSCYYLIYYNCYCYYNFSNIRLATSEARLALWTFFIR